MIEKLLLYNIKAKLINNDTLELDDTEMEDSINGKALFYALITSPIHIYHRDNAVILVYTYKTEIMNEKTMYHCVVIEDDESINYDYILFGNDPYKTIIANEEQVSKISKVLQNGLDVSIFQK